MSKPDFRSVVQSWDEAEPWRIHPAREHESEEAYWKSGRVQALEAAAYIPEGGSVLDFGCGDGRVAIPLAKLGYRVVAMDASPEMIERLHHQMRVHDSETILTAVNDGLTFTTRAKFDAINARAVFIHHSHADVTRLVSALAKHLKPGGYLICDWPLGPHHERIDWIDVTTWEPAHRMAVAESAGLELVQDGKPSIWRKQ